MWSTSRSFRGLEEVHMGKKKGEVVSTLFQPRAEPFPGFLMLTSNQERWDLVEDLFNGELLLRREICVHVCSDE